jgi:anti-sigma factor RsiW
VTELPRRGRQSAQRAAVRVSGEAANQPELVAVRLRAVPASPPSAAPAPAPGEHHLGDRLAAYVDGELDHDARERVQAHLATCSGCLAEAEAQRRVKELLGGPGPGPSGLLTSRLLAIAAATDDPSDGWPVAESRPARGFGSGGLTGGSFGGSALFGGNALGAERPAAGVDPRAESAGRAGFGRGRRLVFVAAGAFSVAAVALSSALTVSTDATVDEPYGSTSPVAETTSAVSNQTVQVPLFNGVENGPLAAALTSNTSPSPSALPNLRR